MKETNYKLCKCSMATFDDIGGHTLVLGSHEEFVIHMGDFYELPESVQANVEHKDMSID